MARKPKTPPPPHLPWTVSQWDKRRFRLDIILIVCVIWISVIIGWVMYSGTENGILTQALLMAFGLIGTGLTAYIGFATQDDKNRMQTELAAHELETKKAEPANKPPEGFAE